MRHTDLTYLNEILVSGRFIREITLNFGDRTWCLGDPNWLMVDKGARNVLDQVHAYSSNRGWVMILSQVFWNASLCQLMISAHDFGFHKKSLELLKVRQTQYNFCLHSLKWVWKCELTGFPNHTCPNGYKQKSFDFKLFCGQF